LKFFTLEVLVAKDGDKEAKFYGAEGEALNMVEFIAEHMGLWSCEGVVQLHITEQETEDVPFNF